MLALNLLRIAGVFRAVTPGFPGTCTDVALDGSSEDIRIDRQRGIGYLSLLDRDTLQHGGDVNGTVLLLDLNLAEPAPRAAMSRDPAGFRPHGLSLLMRAGEPTRLFALSHPLDGGHTVEIAAQDAGGAFVPVRTVRDPAFVHPNAIAATGPEQFYLVNDRATSEEPSLGQRWREMLGRAGHATLVFFDGGKSTVLLDDLAFPAGLALSPDGSRLYVGESMARALRVYRRDAASGALTLERRVKLESAPDNIDVDEDGKVWIAAHPKLLKFIAHLRDSRERAPAQVLRFDPRHPDAGATQFFADDGARISAASVAAHWRDQILIGALLDKKVLVCKPTP